MKAMKELCPPEKKTGIFAILFVNLMKNMKFCKSVKITVGKEAGGIC